jgi:tetratricopeptide (TPR) repeat protein
MTMYESVPHADPVEIARGYNDLAQVIGDGGRLAESVELTGKVVDVLARHLKRTDRALIVARSNYATGLAQLGRYAEAEPLMREALAAVIESKGPNAPDVAAILQPLAQTLSYRKQFAEAESLARRSYAIRQEAFGPTSPLALVSTRTVLSILTDAGRCSEAMPMARDLIAQRGRVLTETDITLSHAFLLLGECLAATGSLPEAEAAVRQALALRSAALPPTHWAIASTKSVLGQILARRGRRPEAERFLVEGLDGLRRELGSDHREVQEAAVRLEQFRAAPLASAKGGT